jgi:hypothetical protein
MVVAGYLLSSTFIKIKDAYGVKLLDQPTRTLSNGGAGTTPQILKKRVKLVFDLLPEKLEKLVIVNITLSMFAMLQACIQVAEQYAENVMIIPPLLAVLTYALEDLAKYRNPPADEVIFIVYISPVNVDFVILRRDQNFELYVADYDNCELHQCEEMFPRFFTYYQPHATIFVVHNTLFAIVDDLKYRYQPENCTVKPFKRQDYVHLFGALYRSMEDEDFDERYQIPNFSSGYETQIRRHNNLIRHIVLPQWTRVPCEMYGFDGDRQCIKVSYCPEYRQYEHEFYLKKQHVSMQTLLATGSSNQIIGRVDERGVPYILPDKEVTSIKKEVPKPETAPELILDFTTGNLLEHNISTGLKRLDENAFDPFLPSTSSSNLHQQIANILQRRSFSAVHIVTDKELLNGHKDFLHSICSNVSFIPKIRAQLSFCFKKLKIIDNLKIFAIILAENKLMDIYFFQYINGKYEFTNQFLETTLENSEWRIKEECATDIFIFCSRDESPQLELPPKYTVTVFSSPDYKNMGLNGFFDMEKNLKNLTNNKTLQTLFTLNESDRTSDAGIFSETSFTVGGNSNGSSQIKFLFKNGLCGVEIFQNGQKHKLNNSYDNEWTPLYFSMAEGVLEIGEKAKGHFERYPKHVIYDVMKIIGKPMNEIPRDPRWGFELVEHDGIVYFQIETSNGPRLIPQEIVIAKFLKEMKILTESVLNTQIKAISILTEFKLNESQKAVFQKAAQKSYLEVLLFDFIIVQ